MRAIKLICGRNTSRLVLMSLLLLSFLPSAWGQVAEEIPIVTTLRGMFPQATFEVDFHTGFLTVDAPLDLHPKIEETIADLDIPHPQVTIEAKFVEVTVTDINELGVELDILDIIFQGKGIDLDVETAWADFDLGFPADADAWGLWHTRLSPTAFQVVLRALEERGRVSVLSAPRITTLSGRRSEINIIETIPFVAEVETEEVENQPPIITFDIEEEEAGIFLRVTPEVFEGCTLITLTLEPQVIELVEQVDMFVNVGVPPGLGWPVLDERTTVTTMVIDSGQTVVLGGLIRDNVKMMEKRTPLLGDIPLLGYLFRHKHVLEERKNLLIFITAYLLSPEGEKILARR